MRRIVIAVAFVAMLLVLDAAVNDFRFTTSFWNEVREFGRLFNRFVAHGLSQ